MVHYLKIGNFGPINELVEINFEVAEESGDAYEVTMPDGKKLMKLAYIYGANASGKTTVLKAFEFLRTLLLRPYTDKAAELNYEPFLFCEEPDKSLSELEWSFYVDGIRYVYNLMFTRQTIVSEKLVYYQTAKPTEFFQRVTDRNKRLATILFGNKIKVRQREQDLLESNTLHNNTVIGAFAKTNVDIPELEKLNKWCSNFLVGMVTSSHNLNDITTALVDRNPAARNWINTFLNKADQQIAEVDTGDEASLISVPMDSASFSSIAARFHGSSAAKTSTTTTTTTVRVPGIGAAKSLKMYGGGSVERKIDLIHKVADGKTYRLSLLAESSGTKRYFGLGGLLYELIHSSRMLCIDELETSLHPDLMIYFLQIFLLNAKQSQLLITTHNIALMENQDFLRRDALWFSEKKSDGSISLYSAADFDSQVLRKDASLINAYRSGKLGAKPNLGSPYLTED